MAHRLPLEHDCSEDAFSAIREREASTELVLARASLVLLENRKLIAPRDSHG